MHRVDVERRQASLHEERIVLRHDVQERLSRPDDAAWGEVPQVHDPAGLGRRDKRAGMHVGRRPYPFFQLA